ncbi:hypothetical protein ACFWCA_19055 [Streptomyces phaeochromogenes]|uniref:hypothetical protein n=1 Tax=Streptomyces phaeochromogenes TaxID=1923 RepID=UPI0036ACC67E
MTYERLMAEQWPTGKFGRGEPVQRRPLPSLPARPPERRSIQLWTPEEQAEHRAVLEAALATWQVRGKDADRKRAYSRKHSSVTAARRRHLRLVRPRYRPSTTEAA